MVISSTTLIMAAEKKREREKKMGKKTHSMEAEATKSSIM